jgi:hypothetical protein
MSEYYGNAPSKDFFSLVSALQEGFSDDKVGSPGDKNLFSLSTGFQQVERFPSQPQYQYRSNNGESPNQIVTGGSNGDLIFQEIDCEACCNYPCPPEFSDFNPGTIALSFSDTGDWKSHDVDISFSELESFSFRPISSLGSFFTSPVWTERGTDEESWSWGAWSSFPDISLSDSYGVGESWSWWASGDWAGEDESLIKTSGDFGQGGPECKACGGYDKDPANTPTEAINTTKEFASSILITIYYDLKVKTVKTHECDPDFYVEKIDTISQGSWDIWMCADASEQPANSNRQIVRDGTWITPVGGFPTPLGNNEGFPNVCAWSASQGEGEESSHSYSLRSIINDVVLPVEGLEHSDSPPQIDVVSTYCENPTAEGLNPWGTEGLMGAPSPITFIPMKCCGGFGNCGSCSDPDNSWCPCDCTHGDYDGPGCECNPEDNDANTPAEDVCIDGCYLINHPDWRDVCTGGPPTQEELDACNYDPGRFGGSFSITPIPKLGELVNDTTLKVKAPAVEGWAQLGSFIDPERNSPWGPVYFKFNLGFGMGTEIEDNPSSNQNTSDPELGSSVTFRVEVDPPEDDWTCLDGQCVPRYNNVNVTGLDTSDFSPALVVGQNSIPGGVINWVTPDYIVPGDIPGSCPFDENCNCDSECETSTGFVTGLCLGGVCSPSFDEGDCNKRDPLKFHTSVSFFIEVAEVDVEFRCGLSSNNQCVEG